MGLIFRQRAVTQNVKFYFMVSGGERTHIFVYFDWTTYTGNVSLKEIENATLIGSSCENKIQNVDFCAQWPVHSIYRI